MRVRCPDCGEPVEVPARTRSGDLLECPNCAGHALRVRDEGGQWSATLAYRVSCPHCERAVTLAEEGKAGDEIYCCGRRYLLTFEYGAYAAEENVMKLGVMGELPSTFESAGAATPWPAAWPDAGSPWLS